MQKKNIGTSNFLCNKNILNQLSEQKKEITNMKKAINDIKNELIDLKKENIICDKIPSNDKANIKFENEYDFT